MLECLLPLTLPGKSPSQALVSLSKVRLNVQSLVEVFDRLYEMALLGQQGTKVVKGDMLAFFWLRDGLISSVLADCSIAVHGVSTEIALPLIPLA